MQALWSLNKGRCTGARPCRNSCALQPMCPGRRTPPRRLAGGCRVCRPVQLQPAPPALSWRRTALPRRWGQTSKICRLGCAPCNVAAGGHSGLTAWTGAPTSTATAEGWAESTGPVRSERKGAEAGQGRRTGAHGRGTAGGGRPCLGVARRASGKGRTGAERAEGGGPVWAG